MSWRDHARPIIAEVLRETTGQDEKAVRAALRAAYPFGERAYHPYKVWLDEIARQRGKKKVAPPTAKPSQRTSMKDTATLDMWQERK